MTTADPTTSGADPHPHPSSQKLYETIVGIIKEKKLGAGVFEEDELQGWERVKDKISFISRWVKTISERLDVDLACSASEIVLKGNEKHVDWLCRCSKKAAEKLVVQNKSPPPPPPPPPEGKVEIAMLCLNEDTARRNVKEFFEEVSGLYHRVFTSICYGHLTLVMMFNEKVETLRNSLACVEVQNRSELLQLQCGMFCEIGLAFHTSYPKPFPSYVSVAVAPPALTHSVGTSLSIAQLAGAIRHNKISFRALKQVFSCPIDMSQSFASSEPSSSESELST